MTEQPISVDDLRLIDYESYEAIIFDCFGTLLNIEKKTYPYYYYLKKHSYLNKKTYSSIMKEGLMLEDLSEFLGIEENKNILKESKYLLDVELNNISMFEDAKHILEVNKISPKILICSNLAKPYGKVLESIKENKILSFEVGFIKPEIEIYEICLEKLQVQAKNVLFVGDSFISDYLTPQKIGINSIWLNRKK